MLKKAGTVVALATAGLLAVSPLAFAGESGNGERGNVHVTDQENQQQSAQGNGILNGNNVLSGNAVQLCNININALNNVVGAIAPFLSPTTIGQVSNVSQGAGSCDNEATAVGQKTLQTAENENGGND